MNKYDNLFNNTNRESLEDQKTEQNIAALEDIFKYSVSDEKIFEDTSNLGNAGSYFSSSNDKSNVGLFDGIQKNESPADTLEKTGEIGNVDLETLKNYSKMLHEAVEEPKEEVQDSSQSYGGKQKVLTTKPVNKSNDDMSQISEAFISCSILSFVTAGMGVGWLLYIIMHI